MIGYKISRLSFGFYLLQFDEVLKLETQGFTDSFTFNLA